VLKTESGEITVDNRCWIRSGHTLTQVGNMLVAFGGTLMKDGSTTNDVFWMTMDRMEWHLQPCKGDKPVARWVTMPDLGLDSQLPHAGLSAVLQVCC
jgi:hypothetical protein